MPGVMQAAEQNLDASWGTPLEGQHLAASDRHRDPHVRLVPEAYHALSMNDWKFYRTSSAIRHSPPAIMNVARFVDTI